MTEFVDADAYQGGSKQVTVQEIVMAQVQRITKLASTEFHGGYWYAVAVQQVGGAITPIEKYMPAANEAYSNAVDCLADLLAPFYDDRMLSEEDKHLEALSQEFEKLARETDTKDVNWKKTYWYDRKAELKRRFFRQLLFFIKRSSLFSEASYEEEVI
jgi:hypothetical protein